MFFGIICSSSMYLVYPKNKPIKIKKRIFGNLIFLAMNVTIRPMNKINAKKDKFVI